MNLRRITLFIMALLGVLVLSWIVTPATIIPPVAPPNPITVYVAESGLHARLLLPQDDRWMQYGFGDWEYYALNRQDLPRALLALLWPTPGALGIGEVTSLPEFRARAEQAGFYLLSFEVATAQVNQLRRSLQVRFEQQSSQGVVRNRITHLTLVRDDQTYSLLHNSNHELAEWLEALNCEVKHLLLWAEFRLAKTEK